MSRLEIAAERLTRALDALEKTALPLVQARAEAEAGHKKLAEAEAARDRLLARVAELEEEARALSGITEEVEGRLDGAIADIRAALGR